VLRCDPSKAGSSGLVELPFEVQPRQI
jgi:hypothetical protein